MVRLFALGVDDFREDLVLEEAGVVEVGEGVETTSLRVVDFPLLVLGSSLVCLFPFLV